MVSFLSQHKPRTHFVKHFRASLRQDAGGDVFIEKSPSISDYMERLYRSPKYYVDPTQRADV